MSNLIVSPIPAPKVLLEGDAGTGKTTSLVTLRQAGITPFIIFTEQGMPALAKSAKMYDVPLSEIHWRSLPAATPTFGEMIESAKKINTLSYKALCGLSDINKSKYNQYWKVLEALDSFTCDCCGKNWGSVMHWKTDQALCIDNLTGLSDMSKDLMIGSKPTMAEGEWGIAMDNLERGQKRLTQIHCWYVLLAHLAPEKDEVTGGIKNMPWTLGKKLPPKLPRLFTDVIETVREGNEFFWRTDSIGTVTKPTHVPIQGKITPSFEVMLEMWKAAGGVLESSQEDIPQDAKTT